MEGKKHGGARVGAGRSTRADEQQLVERLSPMDDLALIKLNENIESGERWAVELFFKYRYGMPKQMIDHTTNGNDINSQPSIVFKSFNSDVE